MLGKILLKHPPDKVCCQSRCLTPAGVGRIRDLRTPCYTFIVITMPHASGVPSRRARRHSWSGNLITRHMKGVKQNRDAEKCHVDLGSLGYGLLGHRGPEHADHRLIDQGTLPT